MISTIAKWIAVGAMALPLFAQASTFTFNATLNGASENPPSGASATGLATLIYNDAGTLLLTDDKYDFTMATFGLTEVATGFHIHGAATTTENATVRVDLAGPSFIVALNNGATLAVVGGSVAAPTSLFTTTGHPDMSFIDMLKGGLAYVNVHTATKPGGVVRGQLLQVAVVPEPETYGMLLAGLALIGAVVRRAKHRA